MSQSDITCAMRRLVVEAGRETLRHFRSDGLAVETKDDDSPVTVADRAADAIIVAGLAAAAPQIPIVTEERVETQTHPAPKRFFLVDPLDGTKEFVSGRGEYTINIALIEEGAPVLGAVFAPAKERLFWTPEAAFAVEEGAAVSNAPIAADEIGETRHLYVATADPHALRVVASKSHRDATTDAYIARRPVASVVSAGSSLKFCLIAAGEADLYPRFGRTMEWDTAAAQAVLRAAGGRVLRATDGLALAYGKPEFENPHFVAAGGGLDITTALDEEAHAA